MSLRQEKKRKARTDIIAAASRLISEQGFEQARMRDIAAAANISYQTLYNYFPTKGSILQALLYSQVETLVAEIEQFISGYQGDLLDTLQRINQRCLAAIRPEDRILWRQAAIDLLEQNPETTTLFALIETQTQTDMQLLLQRAIEFGELSSQVPVTLLSETLFALADYNFLRFLMDPGIQPDALLAHLHEQNELILRPHLRAL